MRARLLSTTRMISAMLTSRRRTAPFFAPGSSNLNTPTAMLSSFCTGYPTTVSACLGTEDGCSRTILLCFFPMPVVIDSAMAWQLTALRNTRIYIAGRIGSSVLLIQDASSALANPWELLNYCKPFRKIRAFALSSLSRHLPPFVRSRMHASAVNSIPGRGWAEPSFGRRSMSDFCQSALCRDWIWNEHHRQVQLSARRFQCCSFMV